MFCTVSCFGHLNPPVEKICGLLFQSQGWKAHKVLKTAKVLAIKQACERLQITIRRTLLLFPHAHLGDYMSSSIPNLRLCSINAVSSDWRIDVVWLCRGNIAPTGGAGCYCSHGHPPSGAPLPGQATMGHRDQVLKLFTLLDADSLGADSVLLYSRLPRRRQCFLCV